MLAERWTAIGRRHRDGFVPSWLRCLQIGQLLLIDINGLRAMRETDGHAGRKLVLILYGKRGTVPGPGTRALRKW